MRTFKRRDAKVPYKMASVFIKYVFQNTHFHKDTANVELLQCTYNEQGLTSTKNHKL